MRTPVSQGELTIDRSATTEDKSANKKDTALAMPCASGEATNNMHENTYFRTNTIRGNTVKSGQGVQATATSACRFTEHANLHD